jgi:transketolase
MASGSEVGLIVAAGQKLAEEGLKVRLVSVPCWELFEKQEPAYRERVLPGSVTARLAVEAGISQGWERFVGSAGAIIALDHYGASAPASTLFKEFGFTVENVIEQAHKLLK